LLCLRSNCLTANLIGKFLLVSFEVECSLTHLGAVRVSTPFSTTHKSAFSGAKPVCEKNLDGSNWLKKSIRRSRTKRLRKIEAVAWILARDFRSWIPFLVPFLLLLGISGYAVVTPYFEFWLVPKDIWPTQKLFVVITIAVYTVALLRPKFMNAPTRRRRSSKVSVYAATLVFLASLAAGAVSRLYLINKFRPSFQQIDVPYVNEAAVGALLQFRNPYNELFFSRIVYNYPPFSLLYYTPFVVIGDLRYGNLVADVLTAAGIFLMGVKGHRPVLGAMVASLFSLSSLSMVTTYYGNNHMVTASFLVLTMLALVYKRPGVAGCLSALSALTTQLGALAVPFVLYHAYTIGKLRRVLLAATATASCILLPFAATSKNLAYNLVGFFVFNPTTQILGQVTEFKVLGFPPTRLIGIVLIGALMVYPYFAKNLKKTRDLHVVCAGAIVSTLIFSVLVTPVFFETYLVPSVAMILVYSVL